MVDEIKVRKIVNGYTVDSSWNRTGDKTCIHFKDMKHLVKHLDDCFVKPYDEIKTE